MLVRKVEEAVFKYLGMDFPPDDPVWCDAREVLLTGGWRAGKSTRAAARALRQVLRPTQDGLLWFLGPDYTQTNEEFRYILDWIQRIGIYAKHTIPSEGQRTITTTTGWYLVTKSAKYPEKLGSVAPSGIVMCEPGQMSDEVYAMVVGRLAQKRGWLFMAGTLEDDSAHPRWAWYEDLAYQWLNNPPPEARAFNLPSWTNKHVFPGGENDPEILRLKEIYSEYTFARRIAAIPVGVEHPCLPELWAEHFISNCVTNLNIQIEAGLTFIDGAIGVDYGTSNDHPSAVAVVHQDVLGRFWVRELWTSIGGNPDEIISQVEAFRKRYGIWRVRTDPHQAVLAAKLSGVTAIGSAWATEARIGIANGLTQDNYLYFDSGGTRVMEAFESMRRMRRKRDSRGRLLYLREVGDDPAQAVLYALEELRGVPTYLPDLTSLPSVKQNYAKLPSRAGFVGRS